MYVKYLPFRIVGSSRLDFFLGSKYLSSKRSEKFPSAFGGHMLCYLILFLKLTIS
jgi:hypothetical protein